MKKEMRKELGYDMATKKVHLSEVMHSVLDQVILEKSGEHEGGGMLSELINTMIMDMKMDHEEIRAARTIMLQEMVDGSGITYMGPLMKKLKDEEVDYLYVTYNATYGVPEMDIIIRL